MKHNQTFTRIDLVVTLLCAAFLIVTLGAVGNRGNERAKQIACSSNLGKMAFANMVYADACEGRLVPVEIWDGELADKALSSGGYDITLPNGEVITPWIAIWNINAMFCEILGMSSAGNAGYEISENPLDYYGLPEWLRCPDALPVDESEVESTTVIATSYGYNVTDSIRTAEEFGEGSREARAIDDKIWNKGVPVAEIKRPATKIMFIDGNDMYASSEQGNYIIHWNEHEEVSWEYSAEHGGNHWCEPMYRHREGANVGFADGHAGYRKKQELFYFRDGNVPNQDGTNVDVARNDKLWCYFE
jgi:prepilin-type processing-associated H-X9-DG protein